MIAIEELADVFVELSDTLVSEFDLVEFLQALTDHAAAISGATAVGLVLADAQGSLQYMAASTEAGKALELFQLQSEEGPCRDCFLTNSPVVNADLGEAATIWPTFAPHATAAGFRSVHAFPMRLRGEAFGALNLFGDADTRLAPDRSRVVQALADVATIGLVQEREIARKDTLAGQLQNALDTRIVVEQAKGVIAQRQGIDTKEAFEILRARARSTNRTLAEVSGEALSQIGHR